MRAEKRRDSEEGGELAGSVPPSLPGHGREPLPQHRRRASPPALQHHRHNHAHSRPSVPSSTGTPPLRLRQVRPALRRGIAALLPSPRPAISPKPAPAPLRRSPPPSARHRRTRARAPREGDPAFFNSRGGAPSSIRARRRGVVRRRAARRLGGAGHLGTISCDPQSDQLKTGTIRAGNAYEWHRAKGWRAARAHCAHARRLTWCGRISLPAASHTVLLVGPCPGSRPRGAPRCPPTSDTAAPLAAAARPGRGAASRAGVVPPRLGCVGCRPPGRAARGRPARRTRVRVARPTVLRQGAGPALLRRLPTVRPRSSASTCRVKIIQHRQISGKRGCVSAVERQKS